MVANFPNEHGGLLDANAAELVARRCMARLNRAVDRIRLLHSDDAVATVTALVAEGGRDVDQHFGIDAADHKKQPGPRAGA